ncbi:MAG: Mur ligase family protein [Patescibacteria group bacterium]|jgi:UDP-N-acetylmuramoyl-tripeptide--D-alanyl-D-alanine ligase
MKNLLQKILKSISKSILKKHNPIIIGVTGSVGKTGTVEAIYHVLKNKFSVRKTIGNYNNEIGLPLTIIGEKTANRSILCWLNIFNKGIKQIYSKDYPKILVLEMGVDKPNDMDYLLNLATPNISVITAIGKKPVHVEFFKSPKELVSEKTKIITNLKSTETAILNYDDIAVRLSAKQTKAKTITFGFTKGSELQADNLTLNADFSQGQSLQGYSFKMRYQGKEVPVRLKNIFSKTQIYAVLAAAACAISMKFNLIEISEALYDYQSPKGRMNLIPGIKGTYLIDDSYNASPEATLSALNVLKEIKTSGRKIACLADMLELGTMTIEAHKDVGKSASQSADFIVAVGKASEYIASEAIKFGFPKDKVFTFQNSEEAGLFVQNKILKPGDIVLIKGSQSMRMEKITKELMAEPEKAPELLVRQSTEWLKK